MNTKIFDLIIFLSLFNIIKDGLESEFTNPTPFNCVKWITFFILCVVRFKIYLNKGGTD